MPEGDTIYRAARTLHAALAGRVITEFESVFSQLARVDHDTPLAGRTIERVVSEGKHLIMHFSGDLRLRTHMRMHGTWHLYKPGERWQMRHSDMRIVIETDAWVAVAFNVPVAEFNDDVAIGPDLLAETFDFDEATKRMRACANEEIADVLLEQRVVAGIGNEYKNEVLFVARRPVRARVRAHGRTAPAHPRDRAQADDRERHEAGLRTRDHVQPPPAPAAIRVRPRGPAVPPVRNAGAIREAGKARARHVLVRAVPGARYNTGMIILPNDLTSQEIRVLQEFRRLNLETMTPDQVSAIKHPAGGGEQPAVGLVGKGWLTADSGGYTLTDKARAFLAIDAKPMFEEAGPAAETSDAEAAVEGA